MREVFDGRGRWKGFSISAVGDAGAAAFVLDAEVGGAGVGESVVIWKGSSSMSTRS